MSFKCKKCNKEFTRKYGLLKHEKDKICEKKLFECPKCNAKYARKQTLARHIEKKHSNDSNNLKLLVKNKKNISNNEHKKVACPFCDKKYSNKYVLKKHVAYNCKKNTNISPNSEKKTQKTLPVEKKKVNSEIIIQNNIQNNTQNNTQNITNITNNTNNTNITFQLNNFGEESLKNITDEEFINAIINPSGIPSKYLELKYIKQKENRNVYRNSKENKLYVRKNNNWIVEPREDEVYHQMKIKAIDDIDEFIKKDGLILFNKTDIDLRLNRIERASFLMQTIRFMLDKNEEILCGSYTENPSILIKS